ncbi:MAG TPA: bifunctional 2-C-methyl-D-erythritol 4-phosphate cytidylyltransferase/2-C-methyl-D-erythritol 2,4-cyclodiphosphate synthase [Alphaproteobacteria bacterium]|nr:bifunctional 2-C-methyl-D-erythritol 4-phosphate cytidylyltransferase/2-C-methyl-D-erythritol 2,4-cyclodiphosphate synthase [Alphaproteobacteria bacterium]
MKINVLIVAAGAGLRVGSHVPKQFIPLAGKSMLQRTMENYRAHPAIRNIHVVIGAGQEKFCPEILTPITGGARRQDSVRLGLEAMAAGAPDYVLIVDAARPFTSAQIIGRVIENLSEFALLTAIPLSDTIKHRGEDQIVTIDRTNIFSAQTPQAFPFAKILELHQKFQDKDFTDDVALFEHAGLPIQIIQGDTRNLKITTAEDFDMAEALLNAGGESRIGHGFDVHRFKDGDHIWLGGVKIPHSHGVDAHSDGDVILHALTDALLGTIGGGDIGQHFPPSDPKWKDAASDQFVSHAMQLLRTAGGSVVNADITLLAEAPRLGPHREKIQARIAALLNVDASRVNVKATTTEKLGFIGRSEGLAAEAVVMVRVNG